MCKYCNNEKVLYAETSTIRLFIKTNNNSRCLEVETNYNCPNNALCPLKNVPNRTVATLNYCPNCGRKL